MCKICRFLCILLVITSNLTAQNLTLAELVSLSNKQSWTEVDRVYHDSNKGDEERYDVISWSYKKDIYSDKANAWFYAYESDGQLATVSYEVFNKPSFLVIQKGIAASGYKITDSNIEDEKVKTNYESKSHLLVVTYSKRAKDDYEYSQTSLTAYTVNVRPKFASAENGSGLQKSTDDEGNNIEVPLKDGQLHGLLKKFNPEGALLLTATFTNGEKTGPSKEYDADGFVTVEANYVKGELVGDVTWFYYPAAGTVITFSGKMLNGKKNGLWLTKKYVNEKEYLLGFENYVDDVLQGAFKESTTDSIIYGQYRNGDLDGGYKIFRSLVVALTGERTGDSAAATKITEGYYARGTKSGLWKYYSLTGILISEGKYYNDEMEGEWKFYHDRYSEVDNAESYTGKLYKISHYDKGKKNGKSIQYSYLEETPVKCDLTRFPDKTPLDTCYRTKVVSEPSTGYYKDDLLHGPFEVRDSGDVVITKGVYVNDERHGLFTEASIFNDENKRPYYNYEEGFYENGKREGLWKSFRHQAFVHETFYYKSGLLHGKNVYYNAARKPRLEVDYESNKYRSIAVYDSVGEQKTRQYDILSESDAAITCDYKEYSAAGHFSQVYFLPKHNNDVIYPGWFDAYFQDQVDETGGETPSAYADGKYALYDAGAVLLEEGSYKRKEPVGMWTFYFPGTGVYSEKQFTNGLPGIEHFFLENSTTFYNGELKQYHANGKLKCEIDISKGIRNGKSQYFSADGKKLKTEKYKQGIIQ